MLLPLGFQTQCILPFRDTVPLKEGTASFQGISSAHTSVVLLEGHSRILIRPAVSE